MGIRDLFKTRAKPKDDLRDTKDPVLAAAIRRADGDPQPRPPKPQYGVWKTSPNETTARIKPR